jgi:hypothetical protein
LDQQHCEELLGFDFGLIASSFPVYYFVGWPATKYFA